MSEKEAAGKTAQHRISPAPPMPSSRPTLRILEELQDAPSAYCLWRILSDLELFIDSECAPQLFDGGDVELPAPLATGAAVLGDRVSWSAAARSNIASACAFVWEWAEIEGFPEVALQFAEAAARLEPYTASRASTAGRLCRRIAERVRGTMWFRRASRLARLADAEIDFAIAHLGWGNLESELGRFIEAERHAVKALRAALRQGRRSLAASAYHDLMTIRIHTGKYAEAAAFARDAVAFYKSDHPRIPALAHDVAFLWGREGFYSSAAPLYEAVLPFMRVNTERVVVLANLARAAGACRDRLRYERAFQTIAQLREEGEFIPASVYYHVAEGCRSFEEWERAAEYSALALQLAIERGNALIVSQAEALRAELITRTGGDKDVVPPEGGEVDAMRETLLRKLRKHSAPGVVPGAVPPEKYPIQR